MIVLCGHYFHSECLLDWIKMKEFCPNCKKEFDKKAIVEFEKSLKELEDNFEKSELKEPSGKLSKKIVEKKRNQNFDSQSPDQQQRLSPLAQQSSQLVPQSMVRINLNRAPSNIPRNVDTPVQRNSILAEGSEAHLSISPINNSSTRSINANTGRRVANKKPVMSGFTNVNRRESQSSQTNQPLQSNPESQRVSIFSRAHQMNHPQPIDPQDQIEEVNIE